MSEAWGDSVDMVNEFLKVAGKRQELWGYGGRIGWKGFP